MGSERRGVNTEWAEAKRPNLPSPWTWEERTPHPAVVNEIVLTSGENERRGGRWALVGGGGQVGRMVGGTRIDAGKHATAKSKKRIWGERMMAAFEERDVKKRKVGDIWSGLWFSTVPHHLSCFPPLLRAAAGRGWCMYEKAGAVYRPNEFYIIISQTSAGHDRDRGHISRLRMQYSAGMSVSP